MANELTSDEAKALAAEMGTDALDGRAPRQQFTRATKTAQARRAR